jgi:large subunit ribosomal protein L15
MGSGLGKTAGRGHKGQKARAGGFHKLGFEGGQMPLQRRLPKRGFSSRNQSLRATLRLSELNRVATDKVDLLSLKQGGIVSGSVQSVKVFLHGKIERALVLEGLKVTPGVRSAIEAAGGKIMDGT